MKACLFQGRPHDKFSGSVAGLSGRRRPPRPSCLVTHSNILLPSNVVKFYIGDLCLFCRLHDGSALSALLRKWVRRYPVASSSHTSLDSRINAWGSVSDLHACVGFRGNKKVEKHWSNSNLQKLREWVWPWPWTFNIHTKQCSYFSRL